MKKGLFEPDKEPEKERLEHILDYELPQETINRRVAKKAEEIVNNYSQTASDNHVKLYYYVDKESKLDIKKLYAENASGDFVLDKLFVFYEDELVLEKDSINIGSKISKKFQNYQPGKWEEKLDQLYEKLKEKNII